MVSRTVKIAGVDQVIEAINEVELERAIRNATRAARAAAALTASEDYTLSEPVKIELAVQEEPKADGEESPAVEVVQDNVVQKATRGKKVSKTTTAD